MTTNTNIVLTAKNISMQFGGLRAVDGFNLNLVEGELVGLIGPNGAGKTTAFNILTGVYKPSTGQVLIANTDIAQLMPFEISRLGMTRTFQNIRLFRNLSVIDNVMIAGRQHSSHSISDSIIRNARHFSEEEQLRKSALELLHIFGLDSKAELTSDSLPYGEQRKLEIVRALATKPKIILLDEPAAGMNHRETEKLMGTIAQIRKLFGLTVLLIEHDMKLVMGICERILVLDHGVTIAHGTPEQIRRDPKVIQAYLGDTRDN
jgi:branched-chain amino acid transport system ATP-binding protein